MKQKANMKLIYETIKKIKVFFNLFFLDLKLNRENKGTWDVINQEGQIVGKTNYVVEENENPAIYGNFQMKFIYNSFLVNANIECSPWVNEIDFTMRDKWYVFEGEASIGYDTYINERGDLNLQKLNLNTMKNNSLIDHFFLEDKYLHYGNTLGKQLFMGMSLYTSSASSLETKIYDYDEEKELCYSMVEMVPSLQFIDTFQMKMESSDSTISTREKIAEGNMYNQFKEEIEKHCPQIYNWLEFIIETYHLAGIYIVEESIKKLIVNKMTEEELNCFINDDLKRRLQKQTK